MSIIWTDDVEPDEVELIEELESKIAPSGSLPCDDDTMLASSEELEPRFAPSVQWNPIEDE